MEDGRWKMEDGRWKMEDGRWKMEEVRGTGGNFFSSTPYLDEGISMVMRVPTSGRERIHILPPYFFATL